MLFYLKAKVSLKVTNISSPFNEIHSHLVRGNSLNEAKQKFEQHVRRGKQHVEANAINFEYIEVATEI